MKKLLNKLNDFRTMVVILMIICGCLLFACIYLKNREQLLVGSAMDEKIYINNVTYFTNKDTFYITSAGAKFLGNDKDVYSYQLGYYVDDIALSEFNINLEKKSTVKDIINNTSNFSLTEYKNNLSIFKKVKNIKNLKFIFKADTDNDKEFDLEIETPVKFYNVLK